MADIEPAAVLDRHRDALMAIPGVVGVALGQSGSGPVIQLFVSPSADQGFVRRQAIALVADAPLSVVSMHTPTASDNS